MIADFLRKCRCVLECEEDDFQDIVKYFGNEQSASMMPVAILNMWPIYALESEPGKMFSMNHSFQNHLSGTYMIPLMNEHVSQSLEKLINCFYNDEDIGNNRHLYGIDFDEVILLNFPLCSSAMNSIRFGDTNVVYVRASFEDGGKADLLFVKETSDWCWHNIFEKFNIRMDMLISSSKGLGNWFPYTPLYAAMCSSAREDLLPPLFFEVQFELGHTNYFHTIQQKYHKKDANVWEINWANNRQNLNNVSF